MRDKPNSISESSKAKSPAWKSRTSKDKAPGKSEILTRHGKDAETIRKEVMRAKDELRKNPRMFEQLGDNDLLKSD